LRNIIGPAPQGPLDELLLREYNIESSALVEAAPEEEPPEPEQLTLPEAPPAEAMMPAGPGPPPAGPGDMPPELLEMMMAGGQPPPAF
jgi:hypothetical protein